MTVYGPIVANEDRESYEITISSSTRRFAAYTGYAQTQVASSEYGNTESGYQELVYALSRAGFDKERVLNEAEMTIVAPAPPVGVTSTNCLTMVIKSSVPGQQAAIVRAVVLLATMRWYERCLRSRYLM